MNQPRENLPLPVNAVPDGVDADWAPLLDDPFASAWAISDLDPARALRMRSNLAARSDASLRAEVSMRTVRRRGTHGRAIAAGVTALDLYRAADPQALRPGEPLRAMLVELAPGAAMTCHARGSGAAPTLREWIVVSGSATVGGEFVSQRDYGVGPAAADRWESERGALLFFRDAAAAATERLAIVRDRESDWCELGPGIRRRVLWQRGDQAALLYHGQPGVSVPRHRHRYDEECLTLQGELFLDDVLLRAGDYQLAPAGTRHHVTHTDTGAVVFAHGDLDMVFEA
jgi:quercetin dioxygenase-like cupin family protein